MHIDMTESELLAKMHTMNREKIITFLMEEGLSLNSEVTEYAVRLELNIEAKTPEEAVQEFIKLATADNLWDWTYEVTEEDWDDSVLVDAWRTLE